MKSPLDDFVHLPGEPAEYVVAVEQMLAGTPPQSLPPAHDETDESPLGGETPPYDDFWRRA